MSDGPWIDEGERRQVFATGGQFYGEESPPSRGSGGGGGCCLGLAIAAIVLFVGGGIVLMIVLTVLGRTTATGSGSAGLGETIPAALGPIGSEPVVPRGRMSCATGPKAVQIELPASLSEHAVVKFWHTEQEATAAGWDTPTASGMELDIGIDDVGAVELSGSWQIDWPEWFPSSIRLTGDPGLGPMTGPVQAEECSSVEVARAG